MWIQSLYKLLRPFCIFGLIVTLHLVAACNATPTPSLTPSVPTTVPAPTTAAPITPAPTAPPPRITPIPTALPSHGGPIRDHISFVDTLRARGYTVEIADSIEQPFLRGIGTQLRISGGDFAQPVELQSFDYEQDELKSDPLQAAEEDASQIEPSRQPRTMQIEWIARPHFYHKERVIVLYLGSDPQAPALWGELLGPPFVGK